MDSKSLLSRKFEFPVVGGKLKFSAQGSDLEYFLSLVKLSDKKLPLKPNYFKKQCSSSLFLLAQGNKYRSKMAVEYSTG